MQRKVKINNGHGPTPVVWRSQPPGAKPRMPGGGEGGLVTLDYYYPAQLKRWKLKHTKCKIMSQQNSFMLLVSMAYSVT